ncbi:MAG: hypothetical protein QNJ63_04120 [Calothrix sp. MO_192.B10]|nr:hypothetical protein [Calothrix sp. MO_192.B10]
MKTKPLVLLSVSLLTAGLNFSAMPSASATGVTPQQKARLKTAANLVFTSAEKSNFLVIKYKWNFQNKNDIKVKRKGKCYIGQGKFTRFQRFVRDDQALYSIVLCNGKIVTIKYKYKNLGWNQGATPNFDDSVPSEARMIVGYIAKKMQSLYGNNRT